MLPVVCISLLLVLGPAQARAAWPQPVAPYPRGQVIDGRLIALSVNETNETFADVVDLTGARADMRCRSVGHFVRGWPAAWSVNHTEIAAVSGPYDTAEGAYVPCCTLSGQSLEALDRFEVGAWERMALDDRLALWRRLAIEEAVYPLFRDGPDTPALRKAKEGATRDDGQTLAMVRSTKPVRWFDVLAAEPGAILFALYGSRLAVWQRQNMAHDFERAHDWVDPPGPWDKLAELRWANDQPFLLLPAANRWWFITNDGRVWSTPSTGARDRAVDLAWSPEGRAVRAAIIDHDRGRSYVFGAGWYLDLGDELRLVTKKPEDRWPPAVADSALAEQMRAWYGWTTVAGN